MMGLLKTPFVVVDGDPLGLVCNHETERGNLPHPFGDREFLTNFGLDFWGRDGYSQPNGIAPPKSKHRSSFPKTALTCENVGALCCSNLLTSLSSFT